MTDCKVKEKLDEVTTAIAEKENLFQQLNSEIAKTQQVILFLKGQQQALLDLASNENCKAKEEEEKELETSDA